MLDTTQTKALAGKLAALTTARRRLQDAFTAASSACGALGLEPGTDGNPCDAASVGRSLAAAHRDATQAAADLSAVLGTGGNGGNLAWLLARQPECPPGIAAIISTVVENATIPGESPLTFGARVRLALEVLRGADDLRRSKLASEPIAAAIEATAAVVRAEIDGAG